MLLTKLLKGAEKWQKRSCSFGLQKVAMGLFGFEQNACKATGMIGTSVKKTRKRSQPSPPSTTEIRIKR